MLIRMKTTYAGASGSANAGHTIDLPDDEAKTLIAGGYASEEVASVAVETEAPIESAVVAPEATATAPAQSRPNRGRNR